MRKYINEENINNSDLHYFETVVNYIESNGLDGAFFAGFPFLEISGESKPIRGMIVCIKGIFLFITSDEEKKLYRRNTNKILMDGKNIGEKILDEPNIIDFLPLNEDVKIIYDKISNRMDCLLDSDIREAIGLFQNILNLVERDKRKVAIPTSIGAKIVKRSEIEANLDEKQFKLIYQDNNSNLRVRGLAGSGKTILLVKKLAWLHFKNPDLEIAYVFFTKSLKQSIDNFFEKFYLEMNKYGGKPDMTKIHIMHGWGGSNTPGFYSTLCSRVGYLNSQYYTGHDLNYVCGELLEYIYTSHKENEAKIFDYILIDEAQDFRLNFFKLAKVSLKKYGKIIYAYDELQNLSDDKNSIPSPKEIFGDESLCDDCDLPDCYRSPKEIIVAAHALGLGIYHKNKDNQIEFCNMIEDLSAWISTGYKIESGKLDYGYDVVLYREEIIKNEIEDVIVPVKVDQINQNEYVIKEIVRLLEYEDVKQEDILIIDLNALDLNKNCLSFKNDSDEFFKENNLYYDDGKRFFDVNLVNKDSSYNFRKKDKVSYTTIYRAKGNEANIVFIINANNMNSVNIHYHRNRLFTAMTRAKFKVYILGKGGSIDTIISELDEIKNNDYKLKFKCPTVNEIKNHKNRIFKENKKINSFEKFMSWFQKDSNGSINDLLQLILEKYRESDDFESIKEVLENVSNEE